jgi:hypothetical protein
LGLDRLIWQSAECHLGVCVATSQIRMFDVMFFALFENDLESARPPPVFLRRGSRLRVFSMLKPNAQIYPWTTIVQRWNQVPAGAVGERTQSVLYQDSKPPKTVFAAAADSLGTPVRY